ncbi:MAG: TIR domain-containing protein [Clostridiales bacterium]|nr:TIR domain-containing protein [Clostridiales bacterium]
MQSEILLCPECQSENVYFSKKKGLYVCEDCENQFNYTAQKAKGKTLFFSYGHDENTKLVNKIKLDLEARGFTVWIDYERIAEGDNWRKRISEGLLESNLVISFLSSHSMRDKGVCQDELRIALCEKCGYIQPVLLESVDKFTPPQNLTEVQWVDMSDWNSYEFNSEQFNAWYNGKLEQLLLVLNSQEVDSLSGDITTLKSLLTPKLLSIKESTLLSKEFYCREWIFEELNSATDERLIAILGGAGTGKSAISARLQYNLPSVIGCWYCSWNDALSLNGIEFLKTFIFKLSVCISEYRRYILTRIPNIAELLESGNAYEIIEKLINLPMQYVIDGGREVKYFTIDGLDESLINGKSEIASVIKAVAQIMPSWFKFVITARPEKEILLLVDGFKNKKIDLDTNKNSLEDMLFYLQQKGIVDEGVVSSVKQNFLLAELIVKTGSKGLKLSNSLANYYDTAFDRIFKNRTYTSSEKTALSLLINSVSPVTEDVLLNAFNKKSKEFIQFVKSLREFLAFGVERFRVFWSLRTVTLFHASFKEWLISSSAGIYQIDSEESIEITLDFYNKIIDKNSVDVTSVFLKNYELFLVKNNRFDILAKRKAEERYNLIKQKLALSDDFSNKESKIARLDANKIAKIEELSHKISMLSKPIKYHYAKPVVHHGGGAMDDYCEYYVFPCCNYYQASESTPHTVTESGCRAHYGDLSTLPEAITLSASELFEFWKQRLYEECANVDKVYERTYRSIYNSTISHGNFNAMDEASKAFVINMVKNTAKQSASMQIKNRVEELKSKLFYLKADAGVSDEEFEKINEFVNNAIKFEEDIIL